MNYHLGIISDNDEVHATFACHVHGISASLRGWWMPLLLLLLQIVAMMSRCVNIDASLASYHPRDKDHVCVCVSCAQSWTDSSALEQCMTTEQRLKLPWLTNSRRNRHRTSTVAIDQTNAAWWHTRNETIDRCSVLATGRPLLDTVSLLYSSIQNQNANV